MSRVLITGVSGFIGSNLAEKLLNIGHDVYGLLQYVVARDLRSLEGIKDRLKLINGNICDYHSMTKTIKEVNPDYVIHLAAISPVRLSFDIPFEFQNTNYLGSLNIAHAILNSPDSDKRRMIIASTAEVYGMQPRNEPFEETLPLLPSSPYSVSKAAVDMYIRMLINSYDFNATIMRCTNTYGRKYETGFIVEYLISNMLKGNPVSLGSPNSIRDYMFIDDHIDAYIGAMDEKARGQVLNAGTGRATSNIKLAEMIKTLTGYSKDIGSEAYPLGYPTRPQRSDQPYIVLNSVKMLKLLGWEAKVKLEDGLERTIHAMQNL